MYFVALPRTQGPVRVVVIIAVSRPIPRETVGALQRKRMHPAELVAILAGIGYNRSRRCTQQLCEVRVHIAMGVPSPETETRDVVGRQQSESAVVLRILSVRPENRGCSIIDGVARRQGRHVGEQFAPGQRKPLIISVRSQSELGSGNAELPSAIQSFAVTERFGQRAYDEQVKVG